MCKLQSHKLSQHAKLIQSNTCSLPSSCLIFITAVNQPLPIHNTCTHRILQCYLLLSLVRCTSKPRTHALAQTMHTYRTPPVQCYANYNQATTTACHWQSQHPFCFTHSHWVHRLCLASKTMLAYISKPVLIWIRNCIPTQRTVAM